MVDMSLQEMAIMPHSRLPDAIITVGTANFTAESSSVHCLRHGLDRRGLWGFLKPEDSCFDKFLSVCVCVCLFSDWNRPCASRWSCWRTWSWESSRKGSTSWCTHAPGSSRISWSCQRSGRTIPTGEILWPIKKDLSGIS